MTVNIVPTRLPLKGPRPQPLTRPWNIDKDCVLALMPEVNTKWLDYSEQGNDGTITGATKVNNCRFGEGLYFDGNDQVTNTGQSNLPTGSEAHTIEVWAKPSQINADGIMIFWGDKTINLQSLLFFKSTGVIGHGFYGNDVASTNSYTTDWGHYVYVYDGGAQTSHSKEHLYINGVEETLIDVSGGGTPNVTLSTYMSLGVRNYNTATWGDLTGYIDEARIYNRVLADWEVKSLYDQGKS